MKNINELEPKELLQKMIKDLLEVQEVPVANPKMLEDFLMNSAKTIERLGLYCYLAYNLDTKQYEYYSGDKYANLLIQYHYNEYLKINTSDKVIREMQMQFYPQDRKSVV